MTAVPPYSGQSMRTLSPSLWLVRIWERGQQALPYLPIPLLVAAMVVAVVVGALIPDLGPLVPAGLIGVVIAMAAFMRPPVGLFLCAFMLYSRASENLTDFVGVPSIAPVFAIFLLTGLVAREGLGSLFTSRMAYWQPIAIYGLVMVGSIFVAVNQQEAVQTVIDLIRDLIFVLVIVLYARRFVEVRVLIWAFVSAGFLASCLTIYHGISGNDFAFFGFAQTNAAIIVPGELDVVPRPAGYVGDPNFYAMSLLPLIPLALHRARYELYRGMRWLAVLTAIAMSIAIFMTYSRGAYLSFVVLVVGLVAVRYIRLRTVLAVGLLLVLLLPVLPSEYSGRLSTITAVPAALLGDDTPPEDGVADTSVSGRLAEVLAGVYMFADHPVLGVGVSNYSEHYQEYARPLGIRTRSERHAHSLMVEVAAEMGVLGLASFSALILLLFVWLRQAAALDGLTQEMHDLALVLMVALVGFMAASVFLHAAYPRFFWMLVALIVVVHAQAFGRIGRGIVPRLGTVRSLSPVVTPIGRHRSRLALGMLAMMLVAVGASLTVDQQLARRGYPLISRSAEPALAISSADLRPGAMPEDMAADPTPVAVATPAASDIELTLEQIQPAALPASPRDGCQFFSETTHNLCDPFLTFWSNHGGTAVFGAPLTEVLDANGVLIQYLERARLEFRPDTSSGVESVVLSSLGERALANEQTQRAGSPVAPIEQDDCVFEDATQHNVCSRFAYFWLTYGGVSVFGYPISEEIVEGDVHVQYFEHARFEERLDGSDETFGVTLSPLGRQELNRILGQE